MSWRMLCGLAVKLCGSQQAFRSEARILKRLVTKYGERDVEIMLRGAQELHWQSLKGLASSDGIGRRWASMKYWSVANAKKQRLPENVRMVLRGMFG